MVPENLLAKICNCKLGIGETGKLLFLLASLLSSPCQGNFAEANLAVKFAFQFCKQEQKMSFKSDSIVTYCKHQQYLARYCKNFRLHSFKLHAVVSYLPLGKKSLGLF